MEIIVIDGVTRIIGESQGYLGLPLRDIVINDSVTGPETPAMQSAWRLSTDELAALNGGAPIILTVVGTTHPPVMLEVPVSVDGTPTVEGSAIEALRLHVAYQAMAKDRNGDDAKALAFGRFLDARDAAIAKAEGSP